MPHHSYPRHRVVAIAVVILGAFLALGPAGEQPEYISNAQPDWDTAAQSFVIGFRASASLLERAGPDANLVTTLTIFNRAGEFLAALVPDPHPVVRDDERDRGSVRLQPQIIPWNRNDGSITGMVRVHLTLELRSAQGDVLYIGATEEWWEHIR